MKSRDQKSQSKKDLSQFKEAELLFQQDEVPLIEKIESFPKYASRQAIAKFLTKYEIFKKILYINGSIIECGVLHGAGLLTWAKLSSIFESVNHTRKIIGFDTFSGFASLAEKDIRTGTFDDLKDGGLTGCSKDRVLEAIKVYDINRPVSHIPKIELVEGDLCHTAKNYIEDNPQLVVALLYLDVDLFEPTKAAIETFLPRMPKGSVLAFDELNAKIFPGETIAVMESMGLRNLKIERFPFDSYVSYAVLD